MNAQIAPPVKQRSSYACLVGALPAIQGHGRACFPMTVIHLGHGVEGNRVRVTAIRVPVIVLLHPWITDGGALVHAPRPPHHSAAAVPAPQPKAHATTYHALREGTRAVCSTTWAWRATVRLVGFRATPRPGKPRKVVAPRATNAAGTHVWPPVQRGGSRERKRERDNERVCACARCQHANPRHVRRMHCPRQHGWGTSHITRNRGLPRAPQPTHCTTAEEPRPTHCTTAEEPP